MAKEFDIKDIDKMFNEIELDFEAYAIGVINGYQEAAIDRAPSDTGALKHSIRAGVNTETVFYEKGTYDGGNAKQINEIEISRLNLGDEVNIIVGAPYGKYVEEGTSKTAPSRFLMGAAEDLDAISERAKSNVQRNRKG